MIVSLMLERGADGVRDVHADVWPEGSTIRSVCEHIRERERLSGNEVSAMGGNYTNRDGPDPLRRAWFDVTVDLHDGHRPMIWEFMVLEPEQRTIE